MPTVTCPHIRWMIRRDLPEVARNDAASFDRPWTEDGYLATIRRMKSLVMVIEVGGWGNCRIAGQLAYELHPARLLLLRLCVHPQYRRQGVGSLLLHKLVAKLSAHRRTRVETVVPDADLAAHLFLRRCGWLATQVIPGDGGDCYRFAYCLDAVVMEEECRGRH